MKKLFKILILLVFPLGILAQEDSTKVEVVVEKDVEIESSDTTTFNMGRMVITITEDPDAEPQSFEESKREQTQRLTHWNGFDLGINGMFFGSDFDTDPGDFEFLEVDMAKSRSVSFNFAEEKLRLINDYVGIFTGLGITYNSYILKNDYTLQTNKDTTFAIMDSTISLNKNKLRTTWLNVPLMLEINTSLDTDKNFHLAAGAIGGWRLGTRYKQKFERDGNREKVKSRKDFNMVDYKLDATVRLGYRNFTLFATYALTELFEENKTAEVYPFSVGMQLIGF